MYFTVFETDLFHHVTHPRRHVQLINRRSSKDFGAESNLHVHVQEQTHAYDEFK